MNLLESMGLRLTAYGLLSVVCCWYVVATLKLGETFKKYDLGTGTILLAPHCSYCSHNFTLRPVIGHKYRYAICSNTEIAGYRCTVCTGRPAERRPALL